MRYTDKVVFGKDGVETYDPKTGDYTLSEGIETYKWANVSDLKEGVKVLMFDTLLKKAKVVRLNGVYEESFDYIKINDVKYVVTLPKFYRRETVFYVGEANG